MKKYYSIMLDIEEKPCTIIGGGRVAERKALSLLEHGANVTVISPEATEKLQALAADAKIEYVKRAYMPGDLKGSKLVYVATNNLEVSRDCRLEAEAEDIIINVVDVPSLCDFIVPAVVKRGELTISVSTNGCSPMLSRRLREELEEAYGEEYGDYVAILGALRTIAMKELKDIKLREELFRTIVYDEKIGQGLKSQVVKDYDNSNIYINTNKNTNLSTREKLEALVFEVYKNFKKGKGVD